MVPLTCSVCGYEFDTPAKGLTGSTCPRCDEPVAVPAGREVIVSRAGEYANAALVGAALGMVAACLLFLSRF